TDGIRDRAGNGFLAPDKVVQVARATGIVLGKNPAGFKAPIPTAFRHLTASSARKAPGRGRVIIGRDTRASGPEIESALAAGFQSVGIDVGLAGVITLPGGPTITHLSGLSLRLLLLP